VLLAVAARYLELAGDDLVVRGPFAPPIIAGVVIRAGG
jgi:hypothetical protein